jgi:hypothetical protein
MDFTVARRRICDLLEESAYRFEWTDTLEFCFPAAFWAEDVSVFSDGAFVRIDWKTMSFTFDRADVGFGLKLWSWNEFVPCEYGACLASGSGRFIYLGGDIIEIEDLEINLSPYAWVQPRYDSSRTYCWNISSVLKNLKNTWPYPNDAKLAQWAAVTVGTIRRWQQPTAHANFAAVERLINSLPDNVAEILL